MPRNMLWNEETGRVMVIDFERAEVAKPRTVLGTVASNDTLLCRDQTTFIYEKKILTQVRYKGLSNFAPFLQTPFKQCVFLCVSPAFRLVHFPHNSINYISL
ncbi:hypothetical protein BKA66DRAFT_452994, partial [Pyrenochaeta sp. MPI-SDFR-AT-0127]